MTSIITRNFRHFVASQVKESLGEASPTNLYMFIGNPASYANDSVVPAPIDTIANTSYTYWDDMIAAKKVQTSDITFTIPNYEWANNVCYREYNPYDSALFDAPSNSNTFFVVTDDYNVYKCLFNNYGANSIVKPTGTSTSILVTSDGYRWKFMYNITAAEVLKFVTTNYIPVQTLTANNGSAQFSVQQVASNGSIDVVDVTNRGSNYLMNRGSFAAISNSTVVLIANSASGTDDIYNGSTLYISSGLGVGQVREIVNYVGATKTATINTAFITTPNTSSSYVVGPKVTITGDGTGAVAYANVTTSNTINYVNMISVGTGYSKAGVAITANSGSGAIAIAQIAPPGGHGSDAVRELGGYNIMINTILDGTEANTFPIVNDFRRVGLIANPLLANGSLATSSSYNQMTKLTLTGVANSGLFISDEFIAGSTSLAKARVVAFANTNSSNTVGVLSLVSSNNTFVVTETITGNTSGVTATIASISYGSLKSYSGNLIYIDNMLSITRATDQKEDVKIVFTF